MGGEARRQLAEGDLVVWRGPAATAGDEKTAELLRRCAEQFGGGPFRVVRIESVAQQPGLRTFALDIVDLVDPKKDKRFTVGAHLVVLQEVPQKGAGE